MLTELARYVWFSLLLAVGCGSSAVTATTPPEEAATATAAVRYQVRDVQRAIAFYTEHLGFVIEQDAAPAFAKVRKGALSLWLSGPKSSGAQPLPDGRTQSPGGWNRIVVQVDDLPGVIEAFEAEGLRFRNRMLAGPGGRQIQLEDPDGNPVELFEPAPRS